MIQRFDLLVSHVIPKVSEPGGWSYWEDAIFDTPVHYQGVENECTRSGSFPAFLLVNVVPRSCRC